MELKQEFAEKVLKHGNYTVKYLPDGYLSIRYKEYDCFGQFMDREVTEDGMARILNYISEIYPYADDDYEYLPEHQENKKGGLQLKQEKPAESIGIDVNIIWARNNRKDKKILKDRVKSDIDRRMFEDTALKVHKMLDYDIPIDIIKDVFKDVPEAEIDMLHRKFRLSK